MAFALSSEPFLLKEGFLFIGSWDTPEDITSSDTRDPLDRFTGSEIGYFTQGSLSTQLQRQYAEFVASTPALKIRKDLIRKDFSFEFTSAQFEPDVIELLQGTLKFDVNATTPTTKTVNVNMIGPDEPLQPFNGFLLSTERTDGKGFHVAMWRGKVTSEDVSVAPSGTEHATIAGTIESFSDSRFTSGDATQRHYGAFFIDQG